MNLFESEDDSISMNIGYRADEPRRQANDVYRYVVSQAIGGNQKWAEIEWRDSHFPLRKYGIDLLIIKSFFARKPEYVFPKESNCVFCFNKIEQVLQQQFEEEPEKMNWAVWQEFITGKRFNISMSLTDIKNKDYTGAPVEQSHVTCNCTD